MMNSVFSFSSIRPRIGKCLLCLRFKIDRPGAVGGGVAVHPFPALSIHIPRALVQTQIQMQ